MNELNLKINWKITELESPIDLTIRALTFHIDETTYDNNLDNVIDFLTVSDPYLRPKFRFWCSIHIKEQNKMIYGFTELSYHILNVDGGEKYIEDMKSHFVRDLLLKAWLEREK